MATAVQIRNYFANNSKNQKIINLYNQGKAATITVNSPIQEAIFIDNFATKDCFFKFKDLNNALLERNCIFQKLLGLVQAFYENDAKIFVKHSDAIHGKAFQGYLYSILNDFFRFNKYQDLSTFISYEINQLEIISNKGSYSAYQNLGILQFIQNTLRNYDLLSENDTPHNLSLKCFELTKNLTNDFKGSMINRYKVASKDYSMIESYLWYLLDTSESYEEVRINLLRRKAMIINNRFKSSVYIKSLSCNSTLVTKRKTSYYNSENLEKSAKQNPRPEDKINEKVDEAVKQILDKNIKSKVTENANNIFDGVITLKKFKQTLFPLAKNKDPKLIQDLILLEKIESLHDIIWNILCAIFDDTRISYLPLGVNNKKTISDKEIEFLKPNYNIFPLPDKICQKIIEPFQKK